jgi:hypothetical protein
MLLALVSPLALSPLMPAVEHWIWDHGWARATATWFIIVEYATLFPFEIAALLFTWGTFLLSSREGYDAADRADAAQRRRLRFAVLGPWAPLLLLHVNLLTDDTLRQYLGEPILLSFAAALGTLGSIPLVILIARRLRALARRARSAHLAEHCRIVGIGTSCTLVYVLIVTVFMQFAADLVGPYWTSRGSTPLLILLLMATAAALFIFWQLYLLIRFAIAFGQASRNLRCAWRRDDRAQST